MKLTNISINEFSQGRDLELNNLSPGLNVIYGANGTGKSTIRRFLRGMQLNFNGGAAQTDFYRDLPMFGSLDVVDKSRRFRIAHRNLSTGARFYVESPEHGAAVAPAPNQSLKTIDRETYDQMLNIGFSDDAQEAYSLVSVLTNRFGVKRGDIVAPLVDAATIREREAELANQRELIAELVRRVDHLARQIAERNTGKRAEIESLSRHITDLTDRITALESLLTASRNRLRELDIDIEDLRLHIDGLRNQVQFIKLRRDTSRVPELLSQLEVIEQQIARWRKVHSDVQSQRNKLRDEMVTWISDEPSHDELLPFEETRKLLNSIEQRVGDLDEFNTRIQRIIPRRQHEPQDIAIAGGMQKTLVSMREEVYQLCRELTTQQLVSHRKAVVNELKQLRRCYVEVTDHLKRLASRRDALIQEIARLDPARADLILNATHELCGCNDHEQHFLQQTDYYPDYVERRVDVDVSSELGRLQQLEHDRQRLLADLETNTDDLNDLNRRRNELVHRRESLKVDDIDTLRRELADVERRLPEERRRFDGLQRQLEIDRQAAAYRPNILLEHAARHLKRMSRGDLGRIWISEAGNDLMILDAAGKNCSYAALSRSGKDQVRLAICLAAVSALAAQGIHIPVVLDDAFLNMDDQATRHAGELLLEFCQADHQVILFTCRRYVVEALSRPGVTVLDLPDHHFSETSTPTHRYGRSQLPTSLPFLDSDYPRPLHTIDCSLNLFGERHLYDFIDPPQMTTETLIDTTRYLYGDADSEQANTAIDEAATTKTGAADTILEIAERPPREVQPRIRETAKTIDEATHLADTLLMGSDNIATLRRLGVRTVGDLLNFDPSIKRQVFLEEDLDPDLLNAWQSQALLMITIPQLRATDALTLHSCGIHHPEQLAEIDLYDLQERVRQFTESTRGQRMLNSGYSHDTSRLKSWMNAARSNRDRYAKRPWSSRYSRRDSGNRDFDRSDSGPRSLRSSDRSGERAPRSSARAERPNDAVPLKRESAKPDNKSQLAASALKFYLDLTSSVESAPSIGPKTAEKLEKVGIMTVKDMLETPAQEIATRLNYSRIKPGNVRAWQQQATLVCRVPQLRGHDAQFLVACGITDPEQLAAMDPEALYKIVGPFAKTTEGQKISRAGKSPDLAEVTDWINWAQQTRMMKAG